MLDDAPGAAVAESPTASPSDSAAPTSPATTQPAPAAVEKDPPFHEHPRWQQLQNERRTERAVMAEMARKLQAFEAAPKGDDLTPEDEFAHQQAANALLRVMQKHPELKNLIDLAKAAPGLLKSQQTVQQLSQSQRETLMTGTRARLADMAKADGVTDPRALRRIEVLITDEIASLPDGPARFFRGDPSVVTQAYEAAKAFFVPAKPAAPGGVALLNAKNATTSLPPRAAPGNGPGTDALPKIGKEDDPRAGLDAMRRKATEMLRGA